ncbi:hypothetical protein [Streptomyces albus]|uniref:hypothetical protein n=1 Tax=Streptomyces sp. NRRL F-5917 TaxID=1463873 RepID=UPI0004BF5BEC|nr:hypothetical protein [Streptomyces sp. NRRL F-5917]KPC91903.1 hypothetical protein ADL27_27275 [Streptomyces sp. NRRL F-6602]
MTTATVSRDQWDDHTPDDRRIPWRKVTAPDTRSGPLHTHPVRGERGMVHTAPWWVEGILYTDHLQWLDLIRRQARASGAQFAEEDAPDGPPANHLAQVEAMRRYAETHGLHPVTIPAPDAEGTAPHVRPY